MISIKRLREFWDLHPDAEGPLRSWFHVAEKAEWESIADVRRDYSHADAVRVESGRTVTIFNIGGNKYRLITAIHYNRKCVYALRVLTHDEYDEGKWKETL